ncbi:hypothetical protein BSKO_13666 [Bryopsis sp. KO-2023]|nr:hypothetical protein BSKO_13666 [Bryopsis sp. KO-2023]
MRARNCGRGAPDVWACGDGRSPAAPKPLRASENEKEEEEEEEEEEGGGGLLRQLTAGAGCRPPSGQGSGIRSRWRGVHEWLSTTVWRAISTVETPVTQPRGNVGEDVFAGGDSARQKPGATTLGRGEGAWGRGCGNHATALHWRAWQARATGWQTDTCWAFSGQDLASFIIALPEQHHHDSPRVQEVDGGRLALGVSVGCASVSQNAPKIIGSSVAGVAMYTAVIRTALLNGQAMEIVCNTWP